MIEWPVTLPQMPFQSYNISPAAGLAKPEETSNPYRTRTYPEWTGPFKFWMTPAQVPLIRDFYDTTLNQIAPFTAPWLDQIGFTHHFARMTSAPQLSCNGTGWEVTINIEIIASVPRDGDGIITYGTVPEPV